ncbi:MAG: hypothetical protein ISS56_07070 [Anaerolineae bacterium]|nr:hypothetical protein [Anaerolineae bacterium]
MKRSVWLLGLLLLLVGLVACQKAASTSAEVVPTATAEATSSPAADGATPKPTATPQPTAIAAASTPTSATGSKPSPTPVEGAVLSPTPTRAWKIPQVRESDWVKGDRGAGAVLVEYSDFQ